MNNVFSAEDRYKIAARYAIWRSVDARSRACMLNSNTPTRDVNAGEYPGPKVEARAR